MTEYVVLAKDGSGLWEPIRNAGGIEVYAASSVNGAIRKAVSNGEGGTFVAVPARSWKPVTVKVETKTALKFS